MSKEKMLELSQIARTLIDKEELTDKLGITKKKPSQIIHEMRKEGHEIWVINTDINEYSVIYKGGEFPEKEYSFSDLIRDHIKESWLNTSELSKLLDHPENRVWGLLSTMHRKGEVERKKNPGGRYRFKLKA
ncbi:hypothetical protein phiV208_52 [Vibrio phage phiV208]|nr:hypothetical protein phiV208_52 [Vibrio phage phiV208]